MPYLLVESESAAEQRSREEALSRGCAPDATTHWWPWPVDPETGAAVLLIEDGDALRPGETASATPPEWL